MNRATRVTALDVDSGDQETIDLPPGNYVVICGGDRYVASEQAHANGTTVVTIKTHRDGGDFR